MQEFTVHFIPQQLYETKLTLLMKSNSKTSKFPNNSLTRSRIQSTNPLSNKRPNSRNFSSQLQLSPRFQKIVQVELRSRTAERSRINSRWRLSREESANRARDKLGQEACMSRGNKPHGKGRSVTPSREERRKYAKVLGGEPGAGMGE